MTTKKSGPFVVDLFAGCGGLGLGLEQAGFTPVFVNELNSDALATYLANRPHHSYLASPDFHCSDVKQLVLQKDAIENLKRNLDRKFDIDVDEGGLDLVAGGPPCQGYSGIGHRRSYSVDKIQLPSNHLYEDMVYVISKLKPKAFLFENVRGLLTARWTKDGDKNEIWNDVQRKFRTEFEQDYFIDFHVVAAREYGVPQNRPRVLMVGLRKKFAPDFVPNKDKRASGLLPEPVKFAPPNLEDLLGDLIDPKFKAGLKATTHYPSPALTDIQRRLRRDPKTGRVRAVGTPLSEHEYSNHSADVIRKFKYMLANGGKIHHSHQTKKFAQRLLPARWDAEGPSITATSLPDDYVHYSQPRSLTVREWARLQMFPDWYEFKGKRTTGGVRRAGNPRLGIFEREVPKYTQIGNAVPVGLAYAVGAHIAKLLGR